MTRDRIAPAPRPDTRAIRTRRTHIVRHAPDRLAALLAEYAHLGMLATRPNDVVIMTRHPNGELTIWFEVFETAPTPRRPAARGLPRHRGVRLTLGFVGAIALLLLTGHVIWLLWADAITAGLLLMLKAGAVLLTVVVLLTVLTGRRDCPGAGRHCPPRFHR